MTEINDVNGLFEQLTLFNIEILANKYVEYCAVEQNRVSRTCKKTNDNTYAAWFQYLDTNRNDVFSKGLDRKTLWLDILQRHATDVEGSNKLMKQMDAIKNKDRTKFYFIMAGLMIIFQVFGDGNHRTANHFYQMLTDRPITPDQNRAIDNIMNRSDFYRLQSEPLLILDIIDRLQNISQKGGRKRRYK